MEVERKKDNKFRITERTPSCRGDFKKKATPLYQELQVFVEDNPEFKMPFAVTETKDQITKSIINRGY